MSDVAERLPTVRIVDARVLQEVAGTSGLSEPDYGYGCAATARQPCDWSAERWAREVFEGAPRPVRAAIVLGWRLGLLLRLGPMGAPTHVLGWRIVERTRTDVLLSVGSPLLEARLVIQARDGAVRHFTFIRFERKLSSVLWAIAAPIHERVIPLLLSAAAGRCRPEE